MAKLFARVIAIEFAVGFAGDRSAPSAWLSTCWTGLCRIAGSVAAYVDSRGKLQSQMGASRFATELRSFRCDEAFAPIGVPDPESVCDSCLVCDCHPVIREEPRMTPGECRAGGTVTIAWIPGGRPGSVTFQCNGFSRSLFSRRQPRGLDGSRQ